MNGQAKWIYRIVVLFLIVMIIDINVNWPRFDPSTHLRMKLADMTLIGALALLLIIGLVIKRKNKVKGGR
jgi:hypothetical protein